MSPSQHKGTPVRKEVETGPEPAQRCANAPSHEAGGSGKEARHLYYNRLRPVGLGTIPRVEWRWVEQPGMVQFRPLACDLPISRRPYGVFGTARPLTREEMYDFEISEEG